MTSLPLKSWMPLGTATLIGAVVTGFVAWHLNVRAIDRRIAQARQGMTTLLLHGKIPPNEQVMTHLLARQHTLEQHEQAWLTRATAAAPLADAAVADPQFYFQEQIHDVLRTLERAAVARGVAVPEQLGLPKELPPSDTVPRLLVQLALIKELAALAFDHGVIALHAFKIDDPESVGEPGASAAFLLRIPVRMRLTSSLPQLLQTLGAIEALRPFVEVRGLRLSGAAAPDQLEAEVTVARYLAAPSVPDVTE